MAFQQTPPRLGDQYEEDRVLRSYLARVLPAEVLGEIEPSLARMGRMAAALYPRQLAERRDEPVLTQWDAWGRRIDQIELTPLWREAERTAAEQGLVAIAYEQAHGHFSRIHQLALAYLFTPATDLYSCPLAMSDGAARTLLESGNRALIERALPRLTSRDPERFWTSGQWMTEATGGSDVGLSESVARRDEHGQWRLFGRKWFTSAATAPMALTLARPEGNPPGGRGLALFYLETRGPEGEARGIRVERLKEKLGTRKLPTAELTLEGAPAELVGDSEGGIRAIAPMLNITRTWNAVSAVALMRRGLALARDYAGRRHAFGAPLSRQPLHVDTLAALQAEFEGAFHLAFRLAELLGRQEAGALDEEERHLWRVLTSIAKLTTARQAVAVLSEVIETFGGAGYVEDTGLPTLLRDAQVLPIWEGTTNVLALDALRALGGEEGMEVVLAEFERCAAEVEDPGLAAGVESAREAVIHALVWLADASQRGTPYVEAGARRFALTLGRVLEIVYLARHAEWSLARDGDERAAAALRRLASVPFAPIPPPSLAGAYLLANDEPFAAPPAAPSSNSSPKRDAS